MQTSNRYSERCRLQGAQRSAAVYVQRRSECLPGGVGRLPEDCRTAADQRIDQQ